jgi:hypothetical protein
MPNIPYDPNINISMETSAMTSIAFGTNHEKERHKFTLFAGKYKITLILLNATMMELELWFIKSAVIIYSI